jgi:flagellin-like hook-associated protein FlgL
MIITMGLLAMNAERQFKIVNKKTNNSLDKLSSGYRINRASDDAAGLSISEKMRSQIRGLTQGTRNIEDGISLCQVADGALEEVSSLLQRIRQLSVQSANDTNTAEDREAIQEEVEQLLFEIDRIGECTEFNTRKLFCGTDQQVYRRKRASETNYREVVETRIGQEERTESLEFSISGKSSDNERKTYTIEQATSADAGIVIGSDVITWDNVKDQSGNAMDLSGEIRAGRYSFDYKGMSVSFTVGEGINADRFFSELKGFKWSTRQQYDGKMHYTFSAESVEKKDSAPVQYTIEATESGLLVNGNFYDWPGIVSSGGSNGDQNFSIQAGYLKLTLSTKSDNTVSYKDIFDNIGTKNITETATWHIRTIIRYAHINTNNGVGIGELNSYYTANELIELMETPPRGVADQEGMWLVWGDRETVKKTWEELYAAATIDTWNTHLVYEFGEDYYEFDVIDPATLEEVINGVNWMDITARQRPIIFHNAISNTLADVYTDDGSFTDLYLNNKLTQEEYEKALIANQFSFSSIGDGTPAKTVNRNISTIPNSIEKPVNMSNPKKEHTTNGFNKSEKGNLLSLSGYGTTRGDYELINKDELIEYFQNRTINGENSGGTSINLLLSGQGSTVSIKMLDALESECDLETFLDAITAKAAYYDEYLVAPIFTQTGEDVEYLVTMTVNGNYLVNETVTQYKDTVDSANKDVYSYLADKIESVPAYSWTEEVEKQYTVRIPIDENGEDIIDSYLGDEHLGLWIQCGANTAQGFMLEIDAMNTSVLGIDELDISTREGADAGITMADLALEKVMRNRSKIGVQQNRLEHAYDGERNAIENTQAAESRIRDTNTAKEVVVLAMQRILGEAGLAMISHANQDMQGVLLLLQ